MVKEKALCASQSAHCCTTGPPTPPRGHVRPAPRTDGDATVETVLTPKWGGPM